MKTRFSIENHRGGFAIEKENKYGVPALDKANRIINLVASQPSSLKLMDISRELDIHKSSMFSLLHTMEKLGWLKRDLGDTYSLGSFFGRIGSVYFRQFDLISDFHREASIVKQRVEETFQLGRLEGDQVFYLAKEEAPSPIKLASEPGMCWPASVTALGKAMLSVKTEEELIALYPEEQLPNFTTNTITTRSVLLNKLKDTQLAGYALDLEEAVNGFSCVAAPIYGSNNEVIAAVSCSIPQHRWESKQELAKREVLQLAKLLSHRQ
ncbi:IclR family transcriptional regulator [Cohnella abietis]|uniref:IclR family transcriptional regulator n=1 Tax=Cohnella abietis TaxID=2507935 RepID=UPI001E4B4E61|nr:IclR family transcriptional regulator [Cohnella abietis]